MVLIGEDKELKDWLAQYEDNVTVSDIESWFQQPGLLEGRHYKVTMSAHCHNLTHVLISA